VGDGSAVADWLAVDFKEQHAALVSIAYGDGVVGDGDDVLVEDFGAHAGPLGRGLETAVVGVEVEAAAVDEEEVLLGLDDEGDAGLLELGDGGRVEVLDAEDVALGGRDGEEVAEAGAHFDHAVFEVKVVFGVVFTVAHLFALGKKLSLLKSVIFNFFVKSASLVMSLSLTFIFKHSQKSLQKFTKHIQKNNLFVLYIKHIFSYYSVYSAINT